MFFSTLKEKIKHHLEKHNGDKLKAFSKDGISELNKGEKKPIKSLKLVNTETDDTHESDITLQRLNRKKAFNSRLYVNTRDNYLFAVMEKGGDRTFDLITFFDAASLLKDGFKDTPDKKSFNKERFFENHFREKHRLGKDDKIFFLKQGDPVYMPDDEEEVITDPESPLYEIFWNDKAERSKNIHYVTKYSGKQIYFIGNRIAETIVKGKEYGSQNAYEMINGKSIKQHCIKVKIDRLGNVSKE